MREIGLEKTQIQHVLDTFLHPNLDLSKCAKSYHHLKAVEDKVTPKLVSKISMPFDLLIFSCRKLIRRFSVMDKYFTTKSLVMLLNFCYHGPTVTRSLFSSGRTMTDSLTKHTTVTDGWIICYIFWSSSRMGMLIFNI